MVATDQKLVDCVGHYRHLLDALPQLPSSLSQAPDSRLDVVIERAGARRRSKELLARLEQAFVDAGITTYPSLTDPDLEAQERVYFLDASREIPGLAPKRKLFRDERTLQEFIKAHQDWFPALRSLELHDFDDEAVLDSGRRVDFLCKKRGSNQLVGIELKVREADDRAVGQLEQYLEDLGAHAASHGFESTHLIVITGQPDQSVRSRVKRYADAHGHEVTFLLYRVHMELLPHPE